MPDQKKLQQLADLETKFNEKWSWAVRWTSLHPHTVLGVAVVSVVLHVVRWFFS